MNMKVENEMALPITKSVTVMLLEPYAGNSHVRFLEGKAPVRGLTYSTQAVTPTPQRLPPVGSGRVSF